LGAPAALAAGSAGALTARLRPALFEAGAEITRVTADLSGVGGPSGIDLAAAVDGSYAVESTFEVSGPGRVENISIAIEQATSLGPYWTHLFRAIEIWPTEDQAIFTDASADGWMLIDRLSQINLTNHLEYDAQPAWLPDGTKIAFTSLRDGNPEIYVMDVDGSNLIKLTDHPEVDGEPAWSPDGTKIAFVSDRDGNSEIM